MVPIQSIICAFAELKRRGVLTHPLYCNLVANADRKVTASLYRSEKHYTKDLASGETFSLFVEQDPRVTITWIPLFFAKIEGPVAACKKALWFLHQELRVCGGSHQCIDQFRYGAADWNRQASRIFLVRCGSFDKKGHRSWRQPSVDALDWVRDPQRYLTHEEHRRHVLSLLAKPLPTGERLTIRRVFEGERLSV